MKLQFQNSTCGIEACIWRNLASHGPENYVVSLHLAHADALLARSACMHGEDKEMKKNIRDEYKVLKVLVRVIMKI